MQNMMTVISFTLFGLKNFLRATASVHSQLQQQKSPCREIALLIFLTFVFSVFLYQNVLHTLIIKHFIMLSLYKGFFSSLLVSSPLPLLFPLLYAVGDHTLVFVQMRQALYP